MPSRDKTNFLISVVCSILIFAASWAIGIYVSRRFGKLYGWTMFYIILIAGLAIFLHGMVKYRK